jgi:hypothetical protein
MERYDFCARVCAHLNGASRRERESVGAELRSHIDDHAAALMDSGWSEEEAYAAAENAMGDADEVGESLSREFSRVWLNISRVSAAVLTVLAILLAAPMIISLAHAAQNIAVRLDPAGAAPGKMSVPGISTMDVRFDMDGGDVVCFYAQSVEPNADAEINKAYRANLFFCSYDRNPFQSVRSNPPCRWYSGDFPPSNSNMGVIYGQSFTSYWYGYYIMRVPVDMGQEKVSVYFDRGGREYYVSFPLDWSSAE